MVRRILLKAMAFDTTTNNIGEQNIERVYCMLDLYWVKLHRCHGNHKGDDQCRPNSDDEFECLDTGDCFSSTTVAASNLGGTGNALVGKGGYAFPPIDLEVGKNRYPMNILTLFRK